MTNQFSLFALRKLERELDREISALDGHIEDHARVSAALDRSAGRIEALRHEISIRKLNRQRWNGKRLAMTIE